jgi:carboxymethylenebutenolidase
MSNGSASPVTGVRGPSSRSPIGGTDIAAAIEHVRSEAGGGADRVFTVGFCRGGGISFQQAADRDLDGVIGFYGSPQGRGSEDDRSPVALAPRFRCPVLGLFGGADRGIPAAEVERFRQVLDQTGIPNEIVVYAGAPHSFFDRTFDQHREACEDAWRRVLAFVRQTPTRPT